MNDLKVNMDFVVESVFSTVSNIGNDLKNEEYINTVVFLEKESLAELETAVNV